MSRRLRLVLASNNAGKLAELQALFAPLPLELCRITARAMARDPAHRYQTVLDLQRAVQAVVAAELPPRDETVRLLAAK